jgi:hypothetical protein
MRKLVDHQYTTEEGILVTVFKPKTPKRNQTFPSMKYTIANIGRQATNLRNAGLSKAGSTS